MNCKILQEKFERITSHLDEKSKRLWCANEAIAMGRGGVATVSAATGISRTAVTEGIKEIKGKKELPEKGRIRRKGGGRKKKTQQFQEQNQSAISVDTKKKENAGNYKNNGREYCKKNSGRSKCI